MSLDNLAIGLKRLGEGSIIIIIAMVIWLISYLVNMIFFPWFMYMPMHHMHLMPVGWNWGGMIGVTLAYIFLIAGFLIWLTSTLNLSKYDSRLSIGNIGSMLQVAGVILISINQIIIVPVVLSGSIDIGMMPVVFSRYVLLRILGSILIALGGVLFGLMLERIRGKEYTGHDMEIAGILYIIGIIILMIPFINIVGSIMVIASAVMIYQGSNELLSKLSGYTQ